MAQVQQTTTAWTIDEHPNPDKVYDWVRDNWHDLYGWGDENRESLEEFCKAFSLYDLDWEVSLCGPSHAKAKLPHTFASGELDEDVMLAEISGARLVLHLYENYAHLLDGDCPFTGYCFDESLLDPIREYLKGGDDATTFQTLIDRCLDAWASAYVADWEYQYTDEGIRDHLECNEYYFTEEGKFLC